MNRVLLYSNYSFLSSVRKNILSVLCNKTQSLMLTSSQQQAHCNSLQSFISIHNVHRCSLIQLEDVAVVIHKYVSMLPVKLLSWRWWGLYKLKCIFVQNKCFVLTVLISLGYVYTHTYNHNWFNCLSFFSIKQYTLTCRDFFVWRVTSEGYALRQRYFMPSAKVDNRHFPSVWLSSVSLSQAELLILKNSCLVSQKTMRSYLSAN